jgi:isoprenylcysteine carboxyl methyltransferase (ICMT) family protein YpbQ
VALFAAFALHHSLLARDGVKQAVARLVPTRLVRSFYVWTASLLFIAVLELWRPLPGDIYALIGWRAAAPLAAQLFGLWIIITAVAAIDPLELAGIRMEAAPAALQVTGPYRWVRHPVYFGWVLLVFGAPHMTATRLAFAAISTAYLVVAVPWEERSLARVFGVQYSRYQRAVRWRIVPYVY